jgi:hypothetical protein
MSVSAFVLSLLLTGQVAFDDRYGAEPTEPAGNVVPPPSFGSPASNPAKSNVGPPPPISNSAPPASAPSASPRQMPTTTADDYGYGAPATSGNPQSPSQLNLPRPPAGSPARSTLGSRPPVATRDIDAEGTSKSRAMMRAMLTAPNGSRLTGRPVSLAEVVSGASSRQEQSRRIDAYWDLCSSVADYYLGVREQDELQRLRSTVTSVGPVWQEAESELGVRIATSQRAAVASQYRLASLMADSGSAGLPLPTDLPHCGDYYARYDQVFAGRQSSEAQQLSELLPMRYQELVDASTAVTRAEEFLAAVGSQRGNGDGTGQLRALELLALRRRAFVQIARDYNRRIARYTELATPGEIGSERVISMLIKRDEAANTATRPGSLAPPPNRQSQVPANDPSQTFAEGWESIKSAAATTPANEADQEVRQAAAEEELETETLKPEPRRERSLLVPRTP